MNNRFAFIGAFLLMIGVLFPSTLFSQDSESSLKGKKVLFVYGGWSGHEPVKCRDIFVPWLKAEGAEVIVSDNLDSYMDESLMSSLDLIVQTWTMGEISRDQEKGLLKAVKKGLDLPAGMVDLEIHLGIIRNTSLW